MLTLFGRLHDFHPLESALMNWETSSQTDVLAMAWNIRSDHRVSEAREDAFLRRHFKSPPTGNELRKALDKHRKEIVGQAKLPEYVFAKLNKNNLVAGHHDAKNLIDKDVKLANILDLNGLFTPFQWYRSGRHKRYFDIDYLAVRKQSNFDLWLSGQLDQQSDSAIEKFVGLCLEVLGDYRNICGPYQPTWVTTWEAFEELKGFDADYWVEKLGVAKWTPHWQIVLKYSVAEAGTLVRPTQIDCGYYAYHFSSPPQAPLSQGGHPMSLRTTRPTTRLLPEYIHKQINYGLHHWISGGSLIGRTQSCPDDLATLRNCHYDLCKKVYGAGIGRWMPRPT